MSDLDDLRHRVLRAVRPDGWSNPAPAARYDLVVLGAGTAGLVAAMGAAGLGARVALVEKAWPGGDCLHTGCVPSKALLRSAHAAASVRALSTLGVDAGAAVVDFTEVMRRLRDRQMTLAHHDGADRFRSAGVDVFFGHGRFIDGSTLEVEGARLRFRRAVIATGGRAAVPPIPGMADVPFLTNETVFDLTALPLRLLVLGAGPIGVELGQAFARLGSRVTIVDRGTQVLPREDADAARLVEASLLRDGVDLRLGAGVEHVDREGGDVVLTVSASGAASSAIRADALLVAVGRSPNVEDLGLEAAGVRVERSGVVVNEFLRTSSSRIYAAGDVCSVYKFTHAAEAQARIVLQNALFFGRRRVSRLVMPWVTFTDPEVAHVGMTHAERAAAGSRIEEITVPFADVDRAVVDGLDEGFLRVYHERGRLRGCTIVGAHAGDLIGEAAYALTHGGTLGMLSATVHPYPTTADAFRRAGDAYRRQSLTPSVRRWFERYFRWTR